MSLSRRLARPMLAAMFIYGGLDALRNPRPKVERAEKVTGQLPVDQDTETLVRANGAAQVAAGGMLALGWFPRLSAAVLAGSLVPTTLAGHAFWEEEEDEGSRAAQTTHFLKNLSMMGGLLLAALDTEGRPSVSYRASHRAAVLAAGGSEKASKAKAKAKETKAEAKARAMEAKAGAKRAAGVTKTKATRAAGRNGRKAADAADRAGRLAAGAADRA
ncbi:MAG: DoxX family protein, partial [Acidimicrobiales bacterium]